MKTVNANLYVSLNRHDDSKSISRSLNLFLMMLLFLAFSLGGRIYHSLINDSFNAVFRLIIPFLRLNFVNLIWASCLRNLSWIQKENFEGYSKSFQPMKILFALLIFQQIPQLP